MGSTSDLKRRLSEQNDGGAGVSFSAQSINWIDPAGAPGWEPASYQRNRDQENRGAKHG